MLSSLPPSPSSSPIVTKFLEYPPARGERGQGRQPGQGTGGRGEAGGCLTGEGRKETDETRRQEERGGGREERREGEGRRGEWEADGMGEMGKELNPFFFSTSGYTQRG